MNAQEHTADVDALVRKHEFTLYGETGKNGLRGKSIELEQRLGALERRVAVICALAAAGGAGGMQLLTKFFS